LINETGTRNMAPNAMGCGDLMPHTPTWRWLPPSAMAGVPLLNGFLSKEMFFKRDAEQKPVW